MPTKRGARAKSKKAQAAEEEPAYLDVPKVPGKTRRAKKSPGKKRTTKKDPVVQVSSLEDHIGPKLDQSEEPSKDEPLADDNDVEAVASPAAVEKEQQSEEVKEISKETWLADRATTDPTSNLPSVVNQEETKVPGFDQNEVEPIIKSDSSFKQALGALEDDEEEKNVEPFQVYPEGRKPSIVFPLEQSPVGREEAFEESKAAQNGSPQEEEESVVSLLDQSVQVYQSFQKPEAADPQREFFLSNASHEEIEFFSSKILTYQKQAQLMKNPDQSPKLARELGFGLFQQHFLYPRMIEYSVEDHPNVAQMICDTNKEALSIIYDFVLKQMEGDSEVEEGQLLDALIKYFVTATFSFTVTNRIKGVERTTSKIRSLLEGSPQDELEFAKLCHGHLVESLVELNTQSKDLPVSIESSPANPTAQGDELLQVSIVYEALTPAFIEEVLPLSIILQVLTIVVRRSPDIELREAFKQEFCGAHYGETLSKLVDRVTLLPRWTFVLSPTSEEPMQPLFKELGLMTPQEQRYYASAVKIFGMKQIALSILAEIETIHTKGDIEFIRYVEASVLAKITQQLLNLIKQVQQDRFDWQQKKHAAEVAAELAAEVEDSQPPPKRKRAKKSTSILNASTAESKPRSERSSSKGDSKARKSTRADKIEKPVSNKPQGDKPSQEEEKKEALDEPSSTTSPSKDELPKSFKPQKGIASFFAPKSSAQPEELLLNLKRSQVEQEAWEEGDFRKLFSKFVKDKEQDQMAVQASYAKNIGADLGLPGSTKASRFDTRHKDINIWDSFYCMDKAPWKFIKKKLYLGRGSPSLNSANLNDANPFQRKLLTPRNPFRKDEQLINYEMDSEDEFQEIYGEDIIEEDLEEESPQRDDEPFDLELVEEGFLVSNDHYSDTEYADDDDDAQSPKSKDWLHRFKVENMKKLKEKRLAMIAQRKAVSIETGPSISEFRAVVFIGSFPLVVQSEDPQESRKSPRKSTGPQRSKRKSSTAPEKEDIRTRLLDIVKMVQASRLRKEAVVQLIRNAFPLVRVVDLRLFMKEVVRKEKIDKRETAIEQILELENLVESIHAPLLAQEIDPQLCPAILSKKDFETNPFRLTCDSATLLEFLKASCGEGQVLDSLIMRYFGVENAEQLQDLTSEVYRQNFDCSIRAKQRLVSQSKHLMKQVTQSRHKLLEEQAVRESILQQIQEKPSEDKIAHSQPIGIQVPLEEDGAALTRHQQGISTPIMDFKNLKPNMEVKKASTKIKVTFENPNDLTFRPATKIDEGSPLKRTRTDREHSFGNRDSTIGQQSGTKQSHRQAKRISEFSIMGPLDYNN